MKCARCGARKALFAAGAYHECRDQLACDDRARQRAWQTQIAEDEERAHDAARPEWL